MDSAGSSYRIAQSIAVNYIAKIYSSVVEMIDDGREQDAAVWNGAGNSGNVITFGNSGGSVYSGGFRFRNINIPRNAKIVLARLRICPAVTDSSDPGAKLIVKGIKESDTKSFTQTSRPSQRPKTVNYTEWRIIKKWEANERAQTPNLKLIIEEIVAQADWKPGNALALIIEDNGSSSDQVETCYDAGKGKGYEAEFEVWYCTSEVTVAYLAGNDRDGVEINKTAWQGSPDGNVIVLGHDGSQPNDGGFIFSGVNIPRRAQILSAILLLTEADQNNRFPNLMIKGFAEDDSSPFSSDGSNRPSLRAKTNAKVEWTIGHEEGGVFVGEHWSAESVYESPDLKDIIQEIVDRGGWAENHKIGLVLENYYSWSGQYKIPWDYLKESGKYGVKLVIAWQRERITDTSDKDYLKYEKANFPEYIIVHHSATARDATHFQTIKNNHIGIGWGDIGYHHWIAGALDGDGLHIPGRPENKIGAHNDSDKMNYRSIGICLCGNFESETPSAAQLATLQSLLDRIRADRGIPREKVFGHRETRGAATVCPGANLLPLVQHYRATGKLQ